MIAFDVQKIHSIIC